MLYREDLDKMTCGDPGCDHTAHDGLYLHGACHIDSPTWAEYREGQLIITCATCKKLIGIIAVASKENK